MRSETVRRRYRTAASHEDLRACLDAIDAALANVDSGALFAVELALVEVLDVDRDSLDRVETALTKWLTGAEHMLRLDADGLLVVLPIAEVAARGSIRPLVQAAAECSAADLRVGVASSPEDGSGAVRLIALAHQRLDEPAGPRLGRR